MLSTSFFAARRWSHKASSEKRMKGTSRANIIWQINWFQKIYKNITNMQARWSKIEYKREQETASGPAFLFWMEIVFVTKCCFPYFLLVSSPFCISRVLSFNLFLWVVLSFLALEIWGNWRYKNTTAQKLKWVQRDKTHNRDYKQRRFFLPQAREIWIWDWNLIVRTGMWLWKQT